MRHFRHYIPAGSLLLEAVITVGVAAAFMSALVGFVVVTNRGSDRALEIEQSLWNTAEGMEALRSITYTSLTNTLSGVLSFTSPTWTLTAGSPQVLPDGSTRIVRVESVSRDASCAVVTSGGTVDPDSKKITSETTWTDTAGRSHTTTTSSIRTNWRNPGGTCWVAQAGQVSFAVDASQFFGGKQLRQLYFTNTGTTNVVIDKIQFTWSNSAKLDQIFIDSSKVWSSSGPGTPTGASISSGTQMDISNFTMTPGMTSQLNKGQFDSAMAGTTLTMSVTFADGSVFTSAPFNPL
jgi:hypothetical protein